MRRCSRGCCYPNPNPNPTCASSSLPRPVPAQPPPLTLPPPQFRRSVFHDPCGQWPAARGPWPVARGRRRRAHAKLTSSVPSNEPGAGSAPSSSVVPVRPSSCPVPVSGRNVQVDTMRCPSKMPTWLIAIEPSAPPSRPVKYAWPAACQRALGRARREVRGGDSPTAPYAATPLRRHVEHPHPPRGLERRGGTWRGRGGTLTKVVRLVPVRELLAVRGHDEGAVRPAAHVACEGEVERADNVRPGHVGRGARHLRAVPVARLGHEVDCAPVSGLRACVRGVGPTCLSGSPWLELVLVVVLVR